MKYKDTGKIMLGVLGFLILILDGKTAVLGMREGIELCLYTLVPALFPFSALSLMITGTLTGKRIRIFAPFIRMLGLPEGSESLLLVGWLGGYPVGAQNVAEIYRHGSLSDEAAAKLVIVCNAAGPSFLFGVLGAVIPDLRMLFILWLIQITGSVMTAMLIPCTGSGIPSLPSGKAGSFPQIIRRAGVSILNVCSCVVLFRMILEFLYRWIFWAFPDTVGVIFSGILELSNGCMQLETIQDTSVRFMIAAGLLPFGGISVWIQTMAVCEGLPVKNYLLWKSLQSFFSITLAACYSKLTETGHPLPFVILVITAYGIFLFLRLKKDIAISKAMMYNIKSASK